MINKSTAIFEFSAVGTLKKSYFFPEENEFHTTGDAEIFINSHPDQFTEGVEYIILTRFKKVNKPIETPIFKNIEE